MPHRYLVRAVDVEVGSHLRCTRLTATSASLAVMSGQLETMGLYRAGAGPCPSDRFDDLAVRILGERLDSGGAHVAERSEPEDESGRRRVVRKLGDGD